MPSIAASMANENITTVLQMVAWGTRLSFGLYDFSANVSSATGDVNSLAKEVNLLSLVLRQVGANLKEDGKLPSDEAFDVVRQILQQCQEVFGEIEAIVPVRQLQDGQGSAGVDNNALAIQLRDGLDWNALSRSKTQYLLAHLESLKLTLSVMLQAIYTAKISAWGRYVAISNKFFIQQANIVYRQQNTQLAIDAMITERLQMESLIIEQQLSLIRAYKQYENFKQKAANTPLLVTQSPHSQALIQRAEYGPSPTSLIPYQEPSLAKIIPSVNETEDLARIRRISSPFVDILLSRWTRLSDIEERMRRINLDSPRTQSPTSTRSLRPERRNSNWRQPLVESDDSGSDDGYPRNRQPKLHINTPGPVLMPADEEAIDVISPIPVPGAGLRPSMPRGPFSPPPPASNSWTPSSNTGNYFPTGNSPRTANSGRPRRSPGPSPLSSPRTSFSSDNPVRPVTAFKSENSPQVLTPQQPQRRAIPYRIRQRQNYWDYLDNKLITSNTSGSLKERDGNNYTEIMSEFVSRDALRERKHEYTRVKKDMGDRNRTRLESCYCIEGALSFSEIQRLVDRTREIRYPTPRSPRTTRPPTLDRSYTAPSASLHRSSHSSSLSAPGVSSDRSDSDSGSSRRRHRSKSRSRRESDAKKGGGGAATLTKLAMGAGGMLTLLDGLPEVLGYI
jgi:hypothetical protein